MRKVIAVLFTVAMSATTFAQGRDLAGTWVLDPAKTGPIQGAPAGAAAGGPVKMFVKQTASEISVAMGSETNVVAFNIDGTEKEQKIGTSKMEWKGNKMLATVSSQRNTMTLTFYRDGAWLVVELIVPAVFIVAAVATGFSFFGLFGFELLRATW